MYEYIPEIMTFKECQKVLKVGKNTDVYKRQIIRCQSMEEHVRYCFYPE